MELLNKMDSVVHSQDIQAIKLLKDLGKADKNGVTSTESILMFSPSKVQPGSSDVSYCMKIPTMSTKLCTRMGQLPIVKIKHKKDKMGLHLMP